VVTRCPYCDGLHAVEEFRALNLFVCPKAPEAGPSAYTYSNDLLGIKELELPEDL
jgi:hypothetical protein